MNAQTGVLVFPAGEINSVELHDALSSCVNVRLYGASSVDRHGEFIYENYISGVPSIWEPDFIDKFNRILEQYQIDVVLPTHDDVALFFAKKQEHINAKVLTADYQTALICRDKKKTYELFSDCGFCPQIFTFEQTLSEDCFPVFIKPRKGQGSVGAKAAFHKEDIPSDICIQDYIICEHLPGEELTVDCFTSYSGQLQAVLPRSRQRIFGGVSVRGQAEPLTEKIQEIAEVINARLNFLGLWYFQVKRDKNGNFKLLEISARCAGTMCLSRAKGVNLALLSVYAAMGKDTEILMNDYMPVVDRTLISRYKTDLQYDRVYVDLDDTILIHGKVNLQCIRFLYQCVNSRKRIILLTRHSADHTDSAVEALKKHRIAPELFDEIIELPFNAPKYAAIQNNERKNGNSSNIKIIFIDNAYTERKEIHKHLGIPVFDVDTIEVLLDWRT